MRLAEATRPLHAAGVDRRAALEQVVRTVDEARGAGIRSPEMSELRGQALNALSTGQREAMVTAIAHIYSTSIVECAMLEK